MRILLCSAALFAGGLVLGIGTRSAEAGPLPALTHLSTDITAMETIGWRRRYWRRYGVWPTVPIEDNAVVVPPGGTIFVSPVRPRSCGQYRYWNGWACVDARYNDPYLGPK
ncbi:MAG: hypothetical protein ACTSYK_04240 [Alphaproteobacteria bacterium]